MLHSAVHYPNDYGLLPRSAGEDGDPLVLVLVTTPVFTGGLVDTRPIALWWMVGGRKGVSPALRAFLPGALRSGRDANGDAGLEGAAEAREAVVRAMELYESKWTSR